MARSESETGLSDQILTDELVKRAEAMVPGIRSRSREAEEIRRIPEATMAEVEEAGFLKIMVPKRFGGHGLGLDALCRVTRALAHGDCSTSWAVSFLIEHNWMLCHMDMRAQESLFAEKSYIKAAAPLMPSGEAIPVPGGYKVSGHWKYASGACNGDWSFVTSWVMTDGERVPHTFLLAHDTVTIHDDWFMSGMAATGSVSITAKEAFVPEERALRTDIFHSADEHPGASHPEPIHRYPLVPPLIIMGSSIILGAAEAVVELAREQLATSKLFGVARIDRPQSRARWAAAHQEVRFAQLLWEKVLAYTIAKCDMEGRWTVEEEGQLHLDVVAIAQKSKEAVRLVMDGINSSTYQLDNPLPRYQRDVDVMVSWPAFDWDVVTERGSRWMLGLGATAADPFPPIANNKGTAHYSFIRQSEGQGVP